MPHYMPIFKAKQGELFALTRLSDAEKARVLPLLELPPVPWDHANDQLAKTAMQHVEKTAKNLFAAWGSHPLILDSMMFDTEHLEKESDKPFFDSHPLAHVALDLMDRGGLVIPCVRLNSTVEHRQAVKTISEKNNAAGIAVRVTLVDCGEAPETVGSQVSGLLSQLGIISQNCHLIVDLGDLNAGNVALVKLFVNLAGIQLGENPWKSFTLAATSFPVNLSDVEKDTTESLERLEWRVFQAYKGGLGKLGGPIYGDYAISSVEQPDVDPRFMRMSAALRYTLDEHYFIVKGRNTRDHGMQQMQNLCQHLVDKSGVYFGKDFSWGDNWIHDCALGGSTGNATVWRKAGLTHHVAVVLRQLANHFGS